MWVLKFPHLLRHASATPTSSLSLFLSLCLSPLFLLLSLPLTSSPSLSYRPLSHSLHSSLPLDLSPRSLYPLARPIPSLAPSRQHCIFHSEETRSRKFPQIGRRL